MTESSSPQLRKVISQSMDRLDSNFHNSSSLLSEEQLLCSICLDVFTDPVTSPCGHNFCKSCITQCWQKSQHCQCPLCKEKFTKTPELKINTTLREVADHFKKKSVSDKSEVLCDACIEKKMKALKSCLDCCASLCEDHLEFHKNMPRFMRHKLINPVKNLEDYICQKHERALELFCKDDQTCVCQFCCEAEHKNHNTVPIEEESDQRKTQLVRTQTDVQQMIQNRLKKIQDIKHSAELNTRSREKEKADSVKVFTDLIRSIEKSHTEMLEGMEENQKAEEKQVEGLIEELEQEITALKRRNTKLEQLSHTEEHLHLLQIYSSMCSPPHMKSWTEISINSELGGDTMRTVLSQLQKILNEKITKTLNDNLKEAVSTELKRIQQYAVDVTLDPFSAHPDLILSADGKQVTDGDIRQYLPDTPMKFNKCVSVLGKQSFYSGRFYYEVQVREKTKWTLGVVNESINRKGSIILTPQNGYWTILLRNEYKACAGPSVPLTLRDRVETVGVFVDYEEGRVSFYDVKSRTHIYSFTGQSFTEKLYPYFSPHLHEGGKNSAPLIISPVFETE